MHEPITLSQESPHDRLRSGIARLALRDASTRPISSRGALQNWLIDLRPVFLEPELLRAAATLFWQTYVDVDRLQVGALETAAIPLLAAILLSKPSDRESVTGFIIRKERKTTGLGQSIEGSVSDAPIVLIDDILNSGASAEKARAVLSDAGKTIAHMFVVIDYTSARGLAWRNTCDIPVRALFGLNEFGLKLNVNPPPPKQRYRLLWHARVAGGYPYYVVPKSEPVLVGDRIYRGCDAGKMQAFDSGSGAVVWEHRATGATPRKGVWSTPAVHRNRLYYGAYNGVVYCLDAANGEEVWSQPACEWVGASPVVAPQHKLLYVGLEYERPWARGSLTALNLETGAKVWERQVTKFQHGSPAYWQKGDLIIWGSADYVMLGLDAQTGKTLWSFRTRRSVKYAAAIDDERQLVAFASFDKSIYVLDVATGEKRGEWKTNEICYTTPLFAGNRLFCGSGDRHLYVIDLDTMELVQKIDLGARIYASPRLMGSRVILATTGGRVLEFDHDSLKIEGVLQLPDAVTNAVALSPDGSQMFVSTYMNDLFAFQREEASVT